MLELDIQLDALRNTHNDLLKFPDEAYAEFMELISKHHITNSAGDDILKWFHSNHMRIEAKIPKNTAQGRAFVDSMNIMHVQFQKSLVMKYENEDYYLYHRPIFDAVKELLLNPEILKNCNWNFAPEYFFNDNGLQERYYSEQWTCKW